MRKFGRMVERKGNNEGYLTRRIQKKKKVPVGRNRWKNVYGASDGKKEGQHRTGIERQKPKGHN